MTTLLIARHGETEWNREERYQGHADPPLNETGRAQAGEESHQPWKGISMMVVELPLLFLITIGVAFFLIVVAMGSQHRRRLWRMGQVSCRACGSSNPTKARFCRRCGKEL